MGAGDCGGTEAVNEVMLGVAQTMLSLFRLSRENQARWLNLPGPSPSWNRLTNSPNCSWVLVGEETGPVEPLLEQARVVDGPFPIL